jgi:hypothetical protein
VTPYSKVTKQPVAFIFHPEEGSGVFLRNAAKFILHYTVCILYNQRDATYTTFFIIISVIHVSGGFSAHRQELIKLYVQSWVLPCFPAVYRWCGAVLGIVMLSCCLPLVWMGCNNDGRKNRPKHVQR